MRARAFFAIPGDLASRTGGYAYDREMITRAPRFGVALEHLPLPRGFPAPTPQELGETLATLRALPRDALLMVDGLALGAFTPDLLRALPSATVALVHHPLALETGLPPADAARLRDSERRALSHAARVIVTSPSTKALLVAEYGVSAETIAVAVPGVDRAPRAHGAAGPPHLLAVGSVTPRKGHDVLVGALAGLTHLDWRLTIAGSLARAPDHARAVAAQIEALGLSSRIRLAGEVDDNELQALYVGAHIFVMPSLYEGYGMVLAEAMARGLPVVATTGGAAADTLPEGAGLKVPPGDADALRDALERLLVDDALRARLAASSWAAGQALPSWDDAARIMADVLASVREGSSA